jgi:hypothetical protein
MKHACRLEAARLIVRARDLLVPESERSSRFKLNLVLSDLERQQHDRIPRRSAVKAEKLARRSSAT